MLPEPLPDSSLSPFLSALGLLTQINSTDLDERSSKPVSIYHVQCK